MKKPLQPNLFRRVKSVQINIAGDLFLGGRFGQQSSERSRAIEKLGTIFKKESLNIVNLESPLTESPIPLAKTGPSLKASPSEARILELMKVQAATLANNHIADYGLRGIKDSLEILTKHNVRALGLEGQNYQPDPIIDWQGRRIAVLNFSENEWSTDKSLGINAVAIDPVLNYDAIQDAKKNADIVLVISHGGHEFFSYPTKRMKDMFRFYVKAGANAVINHHSHRISGMELYENAPIFYSVGNFWFDSPTNSNKAWNKGIIAQLNVDENLKIKARPLHFNQADKELFKPLVGEELIEREKEFQGYSGVINDDLLLSEKFEEWIKIQSRQYKSYLEPFNLRLIKALQVRGFLPSVWNIRQKRILLNLIRSESHREFLMNLLHKDVSDTQK